MDKKSFHWYCIPPPVGRNRWGIESSWPNGNSLNRGCPSDLRCDWLKMVNPFFDLTTNYFVLLNGNSFEVIKRDDSVNKTLCKIIDRGLTGLYPMFGSQNILFDFPAERN